MLSETYSIIDVKVKLEEPYSAYSFTNELQFNNAIRSALDDVELLWLNVMMGSAAYAVTEAKDKVDLTEKEKYLYWSEVYITCVSFLQRRISKLATTTSNKSRENLEIEGYKYETSTEAGGGSVTEMGSAVKEFYNKAVHFMCLAGYNPHNLQKGGNMFSDRSITSEYGDVV